LSTLLLLVVAVAAVGQTIMLAEAAEQEVIFLEQIP
jgi:hypothetical protein